jgi:hypothetical protein
MILILLQIWRGVVSGKVGVAVKEYNPEMGLFSQWLLCRAMDAPGEACEVLIRGQPLVHQSFPGFVSPRSHGHESLR